MSDAIKPTNPDVCEVPPLPDLSKYPDLTKPENLTVENITPFLCDVLKIARDESVDPVIRPGPSAIDISPWLNSLTMLTEVGDPRLSLGELMQKTVAKYVPLLDIKLSILQEGCRLVDEVICDPSGKELYNVKQICGEGGFNIKDIQEDITLESLEKFTYDIWNQKVEKSVTEFSDFLKKTYIDKNWTVDLITYGDDDLKKIRQGKTAPIFYAHAFIVSGNKKQNKYHKYFFDARKKVAEKLNLELKMASIKELRKPNLDDDLMDAISGPYWPEDMD
jgi:hypothetical protein